MLRVLLVLEDYGEMLFLQTLLKKMGFDVDGAQNPRMIHDNILSLNPDILVMTAFGRKVNGYELAAAIRRPRGLPKVILMHPAGTATPPSPHVERWCLSPTTAMDFLRVIAQLGGLDPKQVEEKYNKLNITQPAEDDSERAARATPEVREGTNRHPKVIPGQFNTIAKYEKEREDRNAAFLKTEPTPKALLFNRKQIEENVKDLRRTENPERMADLERERRAFTNELFRRKSDS